MAINPSAVYSYGQTGKNTIEKCCDRIAKAIGALFCRLPYRLKPLLSGGGQEKEGRSETENVPGIAGMAEARVKEVPESSQ